MRIAQVYRPARVVCRPVDTVAVAARRMLTQQVGALAICAGDRLVGIVCERDLVRALANGADPRTAVATYAVCSVHTTSPDEDAAAVACRMRDLAVRRMPVVTSGEVIGMVSQGELLAAELWRSDRNDDEHVERA